MDLEQLQDLADKKLKINDTELDLESLKTPQIHNEFLKHLTKFKLLLSKSQVEYYTQRKLKWEYYTGKASPEVYALKPFSFKLLKTDVDKYLDADPELAKYKQNENARSVLLLTKNAKLSHYVKQRGIKKTDMTPPIPFYDTMRIRKLLDDETK